MRSLRILPIAFATACAGSPTGDGGDGLRLAVRGGDISALARIEQGGAVFRDGNAAVGAIAALRAHGANTFRLRLFLAPNQDEVQVNDLAYTVALAKRVTASGAQLLLDFHYSDTWADPGHQVTPAAWAALGIDALEDTVEAYTARVLDTLRANGALPRLVQVGNEIDGGLLWPVGQLTADTASHTRFGRLLRAAARGVRGASTPADSVRIIVHFSQGADVSGTQWFFDLVGTQQVDYDIVGLSYYPWWHGTIAQLAANLANVSTRYERPVLVVETAYPWNNAWPPDGPYTGTMPWGFTRGGQADFLRDVIETVTLVPGGRGLGVLWWYPESVPVPGLFVWGSGALALFDGSGRILEAADLFGQAFPPPP